MEIDRLRRLVAEGRYEVDPRLVAEAIVEHLRHPEVPPTERPGSIPGQQHFDPRVIPPPHR